MAKLSIRIDLAPLGAVGPGKVRLLELLGETGSISAAGRAMDMSYRRAWLLVDALNHLFKEPVVATKLGGRAGGGAQLTAFGHDVVRHYRALEKEAHDAGKYHLRALEAAMAKRRQPNPRIRKDIAEAD
ncbi:MAG TPA: winged helix-turn-helix domain-containing protein [Stellaceae bacterium]|nr:winged helix-turn-helix domain-containing protein [Stellaceae bacterium]